MTWFLYMLMILGIPIFYYILLYRLRKKIPKGHSIVSIVMGILVFHTILFVLTSLSLYNLTSSYPFPKNLTSFPFQK